MKFKITTIILSFWVSINNIVSQNVKDHATPETFISDLNAFGEEPKKFVFKNLTDHDLIIFDDGLHNALEPFEFYQDYMLAYPGTVDFIFLEVFGFLNPKEYIKKPFTLIPERLNGLYKN